MLGHSFGGWVVFEIALQLSAMGAEIETVIALDTEVPNFLQDSTKRYSHIEMLLELIKLFELSIDGKLGLTETDFLELDQDQQLQLLLSRLTENKILPPKTKIQALRGIVRVFETNLNTHYVPSGIYQNALHLVKVPDVSIESVDDTKINIDYINLWKHHAPKATLWEGPGNHITLLSPSHEIKLAELLQTLVVG